jgi:membrane-bound lytic murein transglycosylase F
MDSRSLEQNLIRNKIGLVGKIIYIKEGSSMAVASDPGSESSSNRISVVKVPYDSDILIDLVATGEIDYAFCDENTANVISTSYPDLDISTAISDFLPQSWAIRKDHSQQLQKEFNQWMTTFRKTEAYAYMYNKYFRNPRTLEIMKSDSYSLNSGIVSPWDDLIKFYSIGISWDWRLLASLICQESSFMPDVKSRRGAYGLMQVMPQTGKYFGIDITSSPRNNIKAGTEYIKWLHLIFDPKIPDKDELTHFILAAYNAGPGHVLDAMKLAEKNGNDPAKWENNVEVWLQKKSDPKYFTDTVVKNGFFKGKESVAFVNEVLGRYQHYKNIIP